jgi:DNA-binding NtrC family response regulator
MNSPPSILVIDDHFAVEAASDKLVYDRSAFLEDYGDLGFEFLFCSAWDERSGKHTLDAAIKCVRDSRQAPDLILLDVRFGDNELLGVDILRGLYSRFPAVPVVMMTSTPKLELWEECALLGAVDYLVKPIKPEILRQTVDRYCERNVQLWLIGQAASFSAAVDQVARASEGGMSSILLLGASGTGKELFARYVHRHGPHRDGPFLAVHIPSISDHLVEAELFGYSKGAFTGAVRDEEGRLLRANGGVLFLDEVGDLAPSVQAALLRVLETREVTRLGDGRTTTLKVQVVAATNANLAQRVKENTFRLDLYNRLATSVVRLPQLSERLDDLPLLVSHFLRRAMVERSLSLQSVTISEDVIRLLRAQSWLGNLRELWNYTQRVLDLARKEAPSTEHFLHALAPSHDGADEGVTTIARSGGDTGQPLHSLPVSVIRGAASFLEQLLLQELSLLWSALDLTRDPVSGSPNRAKAASLLKGKKCSTNEFDRWVQKVMSRLNPELRDRIGREYPEL